MRSTKLVRFSIIQAEHNTFFCNEFRQYSREKKSFVLWARASARKIFIANAAYSALEPETSNASNAL